MFTSRSGEPGGGRPPQGHGRVGTARQGESARRNPALEPARRAEELQRRDRESPLKGGSKLQESEFHAAPPRQPEPLCLDPSGVTGRWVASREYAQRTGIALQTLANWRLADRGGPTDAARARQAVLPPIWQICAIQAARVVGASPGGRMQTAAQGRQWGIRSGHSAKTVH